MDSQKEFRESIQKAPVASIVNKNTGERTVLTQSQVDKYGLTGNIPASEAQPIYKTDNGWTMNAYDAPASISLDTETGNIKIVAPKAITDLPEFSKVFDADTFKTYSLAYKLNPDYKVKIQEYNEETGEQEEKDVTIPEWVQKRDSALKNFMDNVRSAEEEKKRLVEEYGDKANNLSLTNIMMTHQAGKYTYLPKIVTNASFFGDDPNKANPFKKILDKIGDNGEVSAEDLKEIYNRDNFGRTELAGLIATIDGALSSSNWGEDTYITDADGNEVYNRNSAQEAAKLLAFKNFVLSHHPDGNWWQEAGANIEQLSIDAMYGATRVVANIANDVEGLFSLGSSKNAQNYIKDMDSTIEQFHQDRALESDAVQVLATFGLIGGTIAGAWATGKVASGAVGLIGKGASSIIGGALSRGGATLGPAASAALTEETITAIAADSSNFTRGAWIALKFSNAAEKAAIAGNVYKAYMEAHPALNWATSFLVDTIHDALLFDSTTLRDAIESSDENTRNYWLGQLADNAKWWAGMSFAKGAIKFSGKTALGKAANIRATKLINKIAAKVGTKKADLRNKMYGGDVVRKLEEKLVKAREKGETKTANRLKRKIEQERWNTNLREARAKLGDLELRWEGLKLTEESYDEFKNSVTRVKALELGIDRYHRNIEYQRQLMVGTQYDPSTGKVAFINPSLGMANLNATESYFKLADLAKKYNLTLPKNSMISQEMADYMIGRYYEKLAQSFAAGTTKKATEAQQALPVIQANLAEAASRLPDEIITAINKGVDDKVYQIYYLEQNEYAMAKGVVNRAKIEGYYDSPIWSENGYMPIVPILDESTGTFVDVEGRLNAKIEREFEDLNFNVAPGQHYQDPELVRQSRLSETAQMEVNGQLFKAYAGYGSDAANITKISGEETEYARVLKSSRDYLDKAVADSAKAIGEDLDAAVNKVLRRKPIKNVTVPESDRVTIVSSMSPQDVSDFLVQKKYISDGETISGKVTAENYADWYKEQSSSVKKFLAQQYSQYEVDAKLAGEAKNFQYFKQAADEGGTEFENGLQRATLVGDKNFAKSSLMNEARHNLDMGREAFYQGILVADIKGKLRNVKRVDTTAFVDSLIPEYGRLLDSYTKVVLDDGGAVKAINTLSESTEASEQFAKYIALRKLREDGLDRAHKSIDANIDKKIKEIKDVSVEDAETLRKQAHALFDDMLDNEIDDLSMVVRTTNPELIDTKDIYKKAKDLDARIRGEETAIKGKRSDNVVMYLDDQGRQVFAEVDPAFASLYNYRYRMDKAEASTLAKMNALSSRFFRWGTTSVNLKAFGNQLFRDFGNALLIGGSWDTIKNYRKNLVDVFGNNIVEQIGRFDPTGYEMKQLRQIATANGQTLQEAAVSRELMRGAAISPTTTERTLYKEFMKDAYAGDSDVRLQKVKTNFQKFVDKWNPEDLLNGKRENYLRNRVYAHSLNDAMKNGYDLEQSRVFAEFAMNNATTNFSRQLYHLQAIADSTPYFRAAINGTKSFWRMWAMDPVGISGRITGGLILPVMYLTGASLGNEENRKIYENIPEYQKQDNFIFVINGEIISAPMPQELSAIAAPFRQFVEYLHDTNKNDFWELMMNDVLGFFPYDLQGFSTIDMDAMIKDPTIFDRVNRGVARVFSQMAPIPLKSAYMLATGTDPYSGKSLRNPEYSYWNDETNSVETLDYNQNSFAKWFASLDFVKGWMSPDLAEKVVSGVIGTTGSNLLGDITALFANGGGAMLNEAMRNAGESISGPFTIPQYDLTDAIWKRAVRELTAEKEAILNSTEMQTLNNKISQEKDPDERKKLFASRQNLVNEYQNKVGDIVRRLDSEYHGTFDAPKFSAVIQLLNFNTNAPYQQASQYASDLSSGLYYEGKDAAIQTMRDLGIDGVHDTSIFGYLTQDKNGNVVMRYNSPIAIMDMANTWQNQKDYHLANVKALASQNNLWDKKDSVDAQIDAIYAKSKLSDSDYDAIDAIYVNWNAEVMSALAPYVNEMTPEAAINNSEVIQYLSSLIEVPGDYKKDKYGRYVTNSKLGNGSASAAYIKNYIKNIFKVNDTGYKSGKNYSNRKNYDKENKRWTR